MKTMVKLNELRFDLHLHPLHSLDLTSKIFADLKKKIQGKKLGSNEELIAKTEAYFDTKDKSFYKKGVEKLKEHWNECITFEGRHIDKQSRISKEKRLFLIKPDIYRVMCYNHRKQRPRI